MPGNWTAEKREAQSRKLKEHWARKKAAAEKKISDVKQPDSFRVVEKPASLMSRMARFVRGS